MSSVVSAQIVAIPDANFKASLLSADVSNTTASTFYNINNYYEVPSSFNRIDVNNDGEIQNSEVVNIQFLNIENSSITDLTGLAAFVNLKLLICSQNQLGNLDFSQNLGLRELYCRNAGVTNLNVSLNSNLRVLFCDYNQLPTLDVTQNTNLVNLICSSNLLSQINVSQNTALQSLSIDMNSISTLNISQNLLLRTLVCSSNLLTEIDVTPHSQLIGLYCGNNPLSSINVTQNANLETLTCNNIGVLNLNLASNTNLEYLDVSYNILPNIDVSQNINLKTFFCISSQMNNLDVTNNLNLERLYCSFNNLTELDLSNNSKLDQLYCQGNQLNTLNIKNGKIESNVILMANTTLEFICVDEAQTSTIQALAGPSIVVNSYCSFNPGGDNNFITGSILFDANLNGCDASDLPHPNIKININNGVSQGATFTNNTGNYSFYVTEGIFDLTLDVENPSWFTFSPTTVTIPFANDDNNTVTQDFCIAANGVHPNVEIVIAPITPARPGFDAVYQIVYKNIGNQLIAGTIDFSYDDAVLDFVSATVAPNGSSVGSFNWNFTDLLPFENRSIYLTFNVNSPQETPPINIGDQLFFTTTITPLAGDEMLEDNVYGYVGTVIGSYDPNDITCIEGDVVPPSEIGGYLHYVINFENTGTAEAENIVVRTDIDATQFDVNSLQMLNTSHNAYIRQTGNTIEFIFEGIWLDTGGHGNVLLKIKSLNSLQEGDVVAKQANIFFDYNFPIETNIANTTFQALNTPGFEIDNSISVYPNPTNSIVTIKCNNSIQSVQLYDVQGRLLQTQIINNQSTTVDLSQQSNGIYFVKVVSDQGIKVEKVVKN